MKNLLLAIDYYKSNVRFRLIHNIDENNFISLSFNVSMDNIDKDFDFQNMKGKNLRLSYKEENSSIYLCSESDEFIYTYFTFGRGHNCFFNVANDFYLLNTSQLMVPSLYMADNGIVNILNDFLKSIDGLTVNHIFI